MVQGVGFSVLSRGWKGCSASARKIFEMGLAVWGET